MKSIKMNFMYNALYQILVMLVPIITAPYVSRVIGATGVGTYSYSYSIAYYFVMFIMLGVNNYGNRTIASSKKDEYEMSKNFWNIYALQLFLGITITILYFLYAIFISTNTIVSLIMSLYVISAIFDVNWFLFGMEEFKISVIRNTLVKIISTIAIFLFVKGATDIYIYCIILTASILLGQVIVWPYVLKNVRFIKPEFNEITKHIKPNLILFITVIFVSLFKIMDKIMLGSISTLEQVGFYESSEKIVGIPISLIGALGTVTLPRMTSMISLGKRDTTEFIRKSILFSMFFSTSTCFGLMAISKEFVPLFYGPGYEECINLYLALLPSCIFLAFASVIRNQYLLPNKKDKSYVISAMIGAVVNIVLNLILIPRYNALGAAIGTLFTEASVCFYQCWSVRQEISIGRYVKDSLPFLVSGIIMFFFIFTFHSNLENVYMILAIKISVGVILYVVTLLAQILILEKKFKYYIFGNPLKEVLVSKK